MARDLNKFFAEHRKSHTRYISSVDSLIERYEDVGDDELDSVVDLSSFKIFKEKKDIFSRGRLYHPFCSNDKSKGYSEIKRREEDESILAVEEEDSEPVSTSMDYQVLNDMSTCVASFLEEGEPEPSDAETLSSTSSDSYETIFSDCEDDTTQDSCSQEEDFKHTDKHEAKENLYDETDGCPPDKSEKIARQIMTVHSKDTPPYLHREVSGERNMKNRDLRLDETFVIEERGKPNINGTAAHCVKKYSRNLPNECNNNSLADNYNTGHDEFNRMNSGNVLKNASQGLNVKRISTRFTLFNQHNSDNSRGRVSCNTFNNKQQLGVNNDQREEDTYEELYTESSLFSEDSRCPDNNANQKYEIQNNIQLEINKLETSEKSKQRDDSPKNKLNWLNRNFSPRDTSEKVRSPGNDLSLSFRIPGSPRFGEKCNGKTSVRRSNSGKYVPNGRTEAAELSTPLHHRQARKMIISNIRSSPLLKDDTYMNCNETDQESLQEDNRSSKKDSGLSTLHDESLTIDTPVYEEITEVLTLENLDSFNKSLAEQSTFINVSVNCSESKSEEKAEKVEKWLHDVSIEMEKESETTIDRKVNRISQEMCENLTDQRSNNEIGIRKGSGKHRHEVNRQRHNSVEMHKENVMFFNTVVSKSCQPLRKQRYDMNLDTCRDKPLNLNTHDQESFGHGDRHILKVHRNLTPQFQQRLNDDQVAEIMRKCGRSDDSDAFWNEANKRKQSEFSGKRFMDQFDDYNETENKTDVLPTPPKSRKLNRNVNGSTKQIYEEREYACLDGDRQTKFQCQRENVVDNYIEKDRINRYPADDRQEMLAYMLQRNFPKKSQNSRDECKQVRNSGRKDFTGFDARENSPNGESPRKDNRHKEYQNIYHEKEDTSERKAHANFDSSRLQRKMKSHTDGKRLFRSPENRSKQRDEQNFRMQNACISPSNQYRVNQSYIRKLKHNPGFEEIDDGLERHHYDGIGEANEEINSNIERHHFDFEQSPRIKGRHIRKQSSKVTVTNEPTKGGNSEFKEREAGLGKSEAFRKDCNLLFGEYAGDEVINRQYRHTRERSKPEKGHYDEVVRDDTYERYGRNEKYEGISPMVKNTSRKFHVRAEQDIYTNPRNNDLDKFYDRHANYKDACALSNKLSFEKERYSSKKNEDHSNLDRNFVDNDKGFENENESVSPRSRMKRYHPECHLGSPHWERSKHFTEYRIEERSPHQQKNNNAAYWDNMSPTVHRKSTNLLDSEFRSPSTKYNTKEKYEDFNSPVVLKAKASSRQDEFSPSTSLAKMRLNTPKSRSEGRQRQHRRSQSRDEDSERNVAHYQEPCYHSEVCADNTVEMGRINDFGLSKKFFTKNTKNIGNTKESLDSEREDKTFTKMSVGKSSPAQSSPRFVSLDQIGGMPLQFRIQQLESGHSVKGDRQFRDRQRKFSNVEFSNQYICEQSKENSEYYENEQIVDPSLQNHKNSNVYHKYYEVINERGQETDQSPVEQDSAVNINEHDTRKTGERLLTVSSEPKMRKSLFSPTNANRKQNPTSQNRKTMFQSGKGFDAFKIPMSPPAVARNKMNKHNKENEHDKNKVCQQKTKCASSEVTKTVKTSDAFTNKHYTKSGADKMTPLHYMQSTPIKPGIQFTMNTTMSTIMGSDETEINNDANEEIVLI